MILDKCHSSKQVTPQSLFRLGKINEETNRSRPLKLCTDSPADKWEILKRINSLNITGVFARLDLSREEREVDFRLRQELQVR